MAVDRTSGSDVYSCIDCSSVTASGSYDGSSFDCALGSNIGQPICGANSYPGLYDPALLDTFNRLFLPRGFWLTIRVQV